MMKYKRVMLLKIVKLRKKKMSKFMLKKRKLRLLMEIIAQCGMMIQ